MHWEYRAAASWLIFDGDADFPEIPLATPRDGVDGASVIARSIGGGQRRGRPYPDIVLCCYSLSGCSFGWLGEASAICSCSSGACWVRLTNAEALVRQRRLLSSNTWKRFVGICPMCAMLTDVIILKV